jgi:hypothetical protein
MPHKITATLMDNRRINPVFAKKNRMIELSIYDEIADFMAGIDPKKVVAFKPSEANQNRLDALLGK